MLKVEHLEAWGFKHAVRGMRNPHNSWDRSDTWVDKSTGKEVVMVGDNDLSLMRKLYKACTEHRKYLRQIFVSMDITAPLYWWKQFDTYKIGVTTDSCSTMHTLMNKEFKSDDFSFDILLKGPNEDYVEELLECLNDIREAYINYDSIVEECGNNYNLSKSDIQLALYEILPCAYNQKRTVTMNYENVFNIIQQRKNHKLKEWNTLIDELLTLPYVTDILGKE
jgi:hypothetical protein